MKYKKKFKVSIIVVSFNTKKLFLKTINSILNQKFKNFEIIVVDGKSTDGTREIILKKKKYFSNYIIERDEGIYDAMNKGIALSKGEWIMFMNSGDIFFDRLVLEKILKENLSKIDIIFGDTVVDHKFMTVFKKSNYFQNFTVTMPFCHQSSLIKSYFLKKNIFDLNYELSSDFNLFFNSYRSKLKFFKYNGIISKVQSLGKSDTNRQKVFTENIIIFYKKKKYLNILFLINLKIFELVKIIIKICLPQIVIKNVIKLKYFKF